MIITLDTFGWTGLTGTLGLTIYNMDGTVYVERTVNGIFEMPPGTGCYQSNIPDANLAGRKVVWDTGGEDPVEASESFPEDLTDYQPGLHIQRTIGLLARQAQILYPKVDVAVYTTLVLDAWKGFVASVGGVYTRQQDIPVPAGSSNFRLPLDLRQLLPTSSVLIVANGVPVRALSLMRETDAADAWQTAAGDPQFFYALDAMHLGLYPVPLAPVTVRVIYDAHVVPDVIADRMTVDLPAYYDEALRAYAMARVAELPPDPDFNLRNIYDARYNRLVEHWRNQQDRRLFRPAVITPYWTNPNLT